MADPASHRLYVHLAWTTLARVPALDPARGSAIESHVIASCRWLGVEPIEVCALPDRVHLLVRLPAPVSVQRLAAHVREEVRSLLASSGTVVRWGPDFAAVSVSRSQVRRVRKRLAALEPAAPPRAPSRAPAAWPRARGSPGR